MWDSVLSLNLVLKCVRGRLQFVYGAPEWTGLNRNALSPTTWCHTKACIAKSKFDPSDLP